MVMVKSGGSVVNSGVVAVLFMVAVKSGLVAVRVNGGVER